jgi:hypothetical protein
LSHGGDIGEKFLRSGPNFVVGDNVVARRSERSLCEEKRGLIKGLVLIRLQLLPAREARAAGDINGGEKL